jgi:hypothetical protein
MNRYRIRFPWDTYGKGILTTIPSEFLENQNLNLNIQKFKVQVRKMWFRTKLIPSQDSQDLSAAAAAASLITEKSSEPLSVDVTNKGMVSRYLRVFHHVSHFMTHNRTSPWTYMSE